MTEPLDLDALEQLATAALPWTPWQAGTSGNANLVAFAGDDIRPVARVLSDVVLAYLAALSPEKLLALIAQVREARQESEGLRQRVKFTESFETLQNHLRYQTEAANSLHASHTAALCAIENERRAQAENMRLAEALRQAEAGRDEERRLRATSEADLEFTRGREAHWKAQAEELAARIANALA